MKKYGLNMEKVKITYVFRFPDKTKVSYLVEMDEQTMTFLPPPDRALPDWTRLENQQCVHCPLDPQTTPHCPIAANLAHIVEFFKNKVSYDAVTVQVTTEQRTYLKAVSVQDGIFSIFGLIMPLSGCPYLSFLKPMARFHLPFSTSQETIVRSISMYLLRQYFVTKNGGQPDLNLKQLEVKYGEIQQVNEGIIKRIRTMAKRDADVNAMIILHSFSDLLNTEISNDLSSLAYIFEETPGVKTPDTEKA
jgi:hypothetical protein